MRTCLVVDNFKRHSSKVHAVSWKVLICRIVWKLRTAPKTHCDTCKRAEAGLLAELATCP